MAQRFATGKHAYGFCDRCGFRYGLSELKKEIEDERLNGLRVCPECLDVDHPQLQLGQFRIYDPEALQDPRPDLGQLQSQGLFGWNPVGSLLATTAVGKVNVTVE